MAAQTTVLPDSESNSSAALDAKLPTAIRPSDYPLLREIAWSTDPEAELSPAEAFALYERNWRHLDCAAIGANERKLLERLTAIVGKGVFLP